MSKYGLQLRVKPQQKQPTRPPPPKVLGFDDDDDDNVERDILRQAYKKKTHKDVEEQHKKVLEEDPLAFDYDGVYDQMKEKQVRPKEQDRQDRKPRYIQGLIDKAKQREREHEIVYERKLAKERSQDEHLYADKDKFVTSAYKKKLAEQAKWVEEERLRELREQKDDLAGPAFDANGMIYGPQTPGVYARGSQAEWLHMQAKWLVESVLVPLRFFQERCDEEFLCESEMIKIKAADLKSKEVRVNTRILYQQTKFNLLREESEGYAKLFQPTSPPLPTPMLLRLTLPTFACCIMVVQNLGKIQYSVRSKTKSFKKNKKKTKLKIASGGGGGPPGGPPSKAIYPWLTLPELADLLESDKRIVCLHPACKTKRNQKPIMFRTKSDLVNHWNAEHKDDVEAATCTCKKCGTISVKKSLLQNHMEDTKSYFRCPALPFETKCRMIARMKEETTWAKNFKAKANK